METGELRLVTKSKYERDLRELGVASGQTVMLHASVKAVGWVVGGPDVVIQALLDILGDGGTLMMYVGWEDSLYDLAKWPKGRQQAYLEECPPFNPATSRAFRKWSILTEYLRTWPSACRSSNPEASCAAVGAKARWMTENHPLQYGYGLGSPLSKLCEARGKVLLLGAPFTAITLLHHAEHKANVPNRRIVHYKMPILRNGQKVWEEIEEFDTCGGILPGAEDYFKTIPTEYLPHAKGRVGKVGEAQSYLFDAADFVKFAIKWLEKEFSR
jgi:aminoglycoside 3-N-acetyltransferase